LGSLQRGELHCGRRFARLTPALACCSDKQCLCHRVRGDRIFRADSARPHRRLDHCQQIEHQGTGDGESASCSGPSLPIFPRAWFASRSHHRLRRRDDLVARAMGLFSIAQVISSVRVVDFNGDRRQEDHHPLHASALKEVYASRSLWPSIRQGGHSLRHIPLNYLHYFGVIKFTHKIAYRHLACQLGYQDDPVN
jgi:hypothetical protein